MLVEKKIFELDEFELECGRTIPLRIGYETHGTLAPEKDNCILVSHYFTSTSHAAGVYDESDATPGYWDALIGPGKAVDTDRFFVVSCDNLCNIQVKNPKVITTGPASIDPATGKPYGLTFPVVTSLDLANSQKALLEHLGIRHLRAAMGPSLGGMVAIQMAIHHPDFLDVCIGVVTAPWNGISPSFQYNIWHAAQADPNFRDGSYYGGPEPEEAMLTVSKNLILSVYSADFLEKLFPRDFNEEEPYRDIRAWTCYDKKLDVLARDMAVFFDMNSWIYASRITMNHDIRHGFSGLDEAAGKIRAKLLLISNKQDGLENWKDARELVDAVNRTGGSARQVLVDDELGHMAGMNRTGLFQDEIRAMLQA